MSNPSQLFKDDEEEQTSGTPSDDELRHLTGIGSDEEEAMEREANNGAAEDIGARENSPEAPDASPFDSASKAISPSGLAAAEGAFDFNPADVAKANQLEMIKGFADKHKKGLIFGGGGGGIAIGAAALIFLLLVPLKLENIVTNLQNHFFASAQNAVNTESENMFINYIKKEVGPSLSITGCGTTLDKDCTVNVLGNGNNPVTNLYKTWSQNHLETKLADDYGIEFRFDSAKKIYYMKAPGISGDGEEAISKAGETHIDDALFAEVDRGTIRDTVNSAMQNETLLTQMLFRYKIGALLEEKYGIKRCVIYCGTRDALADFANEKKNSAQLYLVQRVLTPLSQTKGIVLQCLLDPTCDATKTEPTEPEPGVDGALNGEAENPETDTAIRTNLTELAANYGITEDADVSKLIANYNDVESKGYSAWMLDSVLEKVGLTDMSDQVTDATPIIGWVTALSQIVTALNHAGPTLEKLTYAEDADAAVDLYSTYATYADEVHTGSVDATEVGSFTDSLGPGDNGTASDPQVGGTAGAEGSPLYASLIDNDSTASTSTTSSLLADLLPGQASADTTAATSSAAPTDLCDNGKPPTGQVCPNEVIGNSSNTTTATTTAIHTFLNEPGIGAITTVAGPISDLSSLLSSLFGGAISAILNTIGFSNITSFISGLIAPLFKDVATQLLPDPFALFMSGARHLDMIAAGADVAGADYSHTGIGGEALTPQQASVITNQQEQAAQQQFDSQPLFARMFSTTSPYSFVNKLADDLPSNAVAGASDAAGLLNPLTDLAHGFSSIFSSTTAFAATPAQSDPFHITQYGYPASAIPADPKAYWDQYCSDGIVDGKVTEAWNTAASTTLDANNMPENTAASNPSGDPTSQGTDPCLLIEASVGVAGGYFNSSLLTQDDLADVNASSGSSSGGSTSSPTDCTAVTGNATILCKAEQYNGIYYRSGGGHQGYAAFVAGCPDPANPPDNQPTGEAGSDGESGNPSPCATDCSGLVSMAVDEAFNQNFNWVVSDIESSPDWTAIPMQSIQPGDVVTQNATHVEIVDTYNSTSGALVTFGSHFTTSATSIITSTLGSWTGAYRYIGPGSSAT
jgi:hypothetical protein